MTKEPIEALRELVEAESAQYPPFEAGQEAQDAWAIRKAQALHNARAALSEQSGDLNNALLLADASLAAMVKWLEENQPDVFSRGIWDAINAAKWKAMERVVCPTCKLPNDWRSALVCHGVAFLCTDHFHLANK